MYLRATTTGSDYSAGQLATAAITTEAFGGLLGATVGAALAGASEHLGLARGDAFATAYVGFAAVLTVATVATARSRRGG